MGGWGEDDALDNWNGHVVPDVVLPCQLAGAMQTKPERRLYMALLEDALWCVPRRASVRQRELSDEALAWINETTNYALGFSQVCERAGLDPAAVRRQALSFTSYRRSSRNARRYSLSTKTAWTRGAIPT